ncbi:MAG TPA: hypothetical protein VN798_08870 [Pseudomonas sp.]|nr:hypothetical protein [Pseudomonas sp.]
MIKVISSSAKISDSAQHERPLDCRHPLVRKGYYLGLDTEEYVCVVCGRSGLGKDWAVIAAHSKSRPA